MSERYTEVMKFYKEPDIIGLEGSRVNCAPLIRDIYAAFSNHTYPGDNEIVHCEYDGRWAAPSKVHVEMLAKRTWCWRVLNFAFVQPKAR
jgi:hypothetical protein